MRKAHLLALPFGALLAGLALGGALARLQPSQAADSFRGYAAEPGTVLGQVQGWSTGLTICPQSQEPGWLAAYTSVMLTDQTRVVDQRGAQPVVAAPEALREGQIVQVRHTPSDNTPPASIEAAEVVILGDGSLPTTPGCFTPSLLQ